jgi:hypothetical protein
MLNAVGLRIPLQTRGLADGTQKQLLEIAALATGQGTDPRRPTAARSQITDMRSTVFCGRKDRNFGSPSPIAWRS